MELYFHLLIKVPKSNSFLGVQDNGEVKNSTESHNSAAAVSFVKAFDASITMFVETRFLSSTQDQTPIRPRIHIMIPERNKNRMFRCRARRTISESGDLCRLIRAICKISRSTSAK